VLCAAGHNTYIHTFCGFAYLATVIDLFSSKVVGWMVAGHMRADLVLDALDMALAARRPGIGEAVMHTDRGAQYTSHDFRDRFRLHRAVLQPRPETAPPGETEPSAF